MFFERLACEGQSLSFCTFFSVDLINAEMCLFLSKTKTNMSINNIKVLGKGLYKVYLSNWTVHTVHDIEVSEFCTDNNIDFEHFISKLNNSN